MASWSGRRAACQDTTVPVPAAARGLSWVTVSVMAGPYVSYGLPRTTTLGKPNVVRYGRGYDRRPLHSRRRPQRRPRVPGRELRSGHPAAHLAGAARRLRLGHPPVADPVVRQGAVHPAGLRRLRRVPQGEGPWAAGRTRPHAGRADDHRPRERRGEEALRPRDPRG